MIHKYTLNGYRIVLDTNSGAVHVFDEVPYEMLNYLDGTVPQEPPKELKEALAGRWDDEVFNEAYEELRELYQQGLLFSEDGYERFSDMMVNSPVKAMCLNVAHDCNLRCEYCFAA